MQRTINFIPILNTLDSIQRKYKKRYCYPGQQTILKLLKAYHQEVLSLRTLNRMLRKLEDSGYLKRTRRITRLASGENKFQTTIYVLRKKAYILIGKLLKKVAHSVVSAFAAISAHIADDPLEDPLPPPGEKWLSQDDNLREARKVIASFKPKRRS